MKALALALLVSCAPGDSAVVDVRGSRGTVAQAQAAARSVMRIVCPAQKEAASAWWFYEVRGAAPGGALTLYNRGRAFDGSPPCGSWGQGEVGRALHAVWNAEPQKVDSALYVTPSGVTLTFTRR